MAQKIRNVGEIESGGDATSATDTTGATMWYTAGFANFGAKAAAAGTVSLKFWSMVAGVRTLSATVVGAIWTFATDIVVTGVAYIGDTANAFMTVGLTINQGAADDEILALKSSDVAHGITAVTETDTFGLAKKLSATDGGVEWRGFGEASKAIGFTSYATTEDSTRSTAAVGPVEIRCQLKSGTGATAMSADKNMVVIGNGATTRFIFDQDGDAHADVSWTTF